MLSGSGEFDAIVVGAGVAGLSAAAVLAKSGRTLVLERHNVPGGCASFYQRDGYRFDVGATLVGGFGIRGVHRLFNASFGIDVSARPVEPAMVVHLPDATVVRYGDDRWPAERRRAFGADAEPFWREQERIAELAWDFSARLPAMPVDPSGVLAAMRAFRPRQLALLGALGRSVASIMPAASPRLRTFVDAQLLITAQADAAGTDLTYGSTALDLAREGTFHLENGVSTIASALALAVRRAGGTIRYRTEVAEIDVVRGRVASVRLSDGSLLRARRVVAAVPVHEVARLCPEFGRGAAERIAALPQRWGAFMTYCGLPAGVVPAALPAHHQFVMDASAPPGEGNTVFLSLSEPGDVRRARGGGCAVTMSTHTDVARWERAARDGTTAALRRTYRARLVAALERVMPGAFARADLVEDADPHTFERYTGRARGLVGGLPASPTRAVLGAFSHRTPVFGLFLCGDTVFPGQSTVGATLGGLAAGRAASR